MPLQPSRRDSFRPVAFIRHHESAIRGLDQGFLGGRFATPQPVLPGPSPLVGGDEGGGDDNDAAVIGEDGDRLTLANLGDQVWTLSYVPIAETLHVHWHPDGGAGVEWKRGEHYDLAEDDNVVTIYASALASGYAEIGDVFSAQYLRLEGEQDGDSDETSGGIDWGSTGPMLTVAEGSTADYSATDFDDSSWVSAAAPGGHPIGPIPPEWGVDWLIVSYDTGATNSGLWMRRTFTVPIDGEVTVYNRVDGRFWLYCDGALINNDSSGGTVGQFDVQVALSAGEHVLAYHVDDDTPDPFGDKTYADLKVEVPQ